MNCLSEEQSNRITHLVREIEKLSDVEKLFLYLQLPCGRAEACETVEGKSKFNGLKSNSDLFSKKPDQETTQTYTWILSHLEVDPSVSLPKQEVYDEYRAFCQANKFEPLCVADFGKAMKHAFPCIKPRRLGQRGNSRYCYSGLRKKYKIQAPNLPDMIEPTFCMDNDCSQAYQQIITDCRDNPSECPLNKSNFTGNEVMNLKIEPGNLQYSMNANTNGTSCGSSISSAHFNDDLAIKQSSSIQHHHQQQMPTTTDTGESRHLRTIQHHTTNNMGPIHHMTPSAQEYIPSNPIPISQTSHSSSMSVRCNYPGTIQQPGTPDDDDYQHNYQDISSTNRHLLNAVNASSAHTQTATSASFTQLQPEQSLKTSTSDGRLMTSDTTMSSSSRITDVNSNTHLVQQTFINDMLGSGPSHPSASAMVGGCSQMQFSHMNSALIDSCASPFQSPASTPYPQMGNYMGSDIQDYYSANDCMRYTN